MILSVQEVNDDKTPDFLDTIAKKLPYKKLTSGMGITAIIDLIILAFASLHKLGQTVYTFIVFMYFLQATAYIVLDFIKANPSKKRNIK